MKSPLLCGLLAAAALSTLASTSFGDSLNLHKFTSIKNDRSLWAIFQQAEADVLNEEQRLPDVSKMFVDYLVVDLNDDDRNEVIFHVKSRRSCRAQQCPVIVAQLQDRIWTAIGFDYASDVMVGPRNPATGQKDVIKNPDTSATPIEVTAKHIPRTDEFVSAEPSS